MVKKAAPTAQPVTPVPVLPAAAQALPIAVAEHAHAATPAPLKKVQDFQILWGQWAARSGSNAATTAALLPQALNAEVWQELAQMQLAVWTRLQAQQQAWIAGCTGLAQEYRNVKRANTMSKLMEQQVNLMGRFGDLLGQQATAFIGLQENIEVNYGYWAAQKLGR